MSGLGIFIYGLVVTSLVAFALGLLAWGIVKERRDRHSLAQGREVFGVRVAANIAAEADEPSRDAA
jgi:hypothetical protein